MPMRPCHQCRYQNCHAKTDKTYCTAHEQEVKRKWQKDTDKHRGTAMERGYGPEWRRYRENYIREHPLCVECLKEDRYTPTEEVDHIKPVNGPYDPLFWEPTNHQGLCGRHHKIKTAKEDGGFGNKER